MASTAEFWKKDHLHLHGHGVAERSSSMLLFFLFETSVIVSVCIFISLTQPQLLNKPLLVQQLMAHAGSDSLTRTLYIRWLAYIHTPI